VGRRSHYAKSSALQEVDFAAHRVARTLSPDRAARCRRCQWARSGLHPEAASILTAAEYMVRWWSVADHSGVASC
jgi:hypothetical protein